MILNVNKMKWQKYRFQTQTWWGGDGDSGLHYRIWKEHIEK